MITSQELADKTQSEHIGKNQDIAGLTDSWEVKTGYISYVSKPDKLTIDNSQKPILLLNAKYKDKINTETYPNSTILYTNNSRLVFAYASQALKAKPVFTGIASSIKVGTNCHISKTANIADYVVLGNNTTIGENVTIKANCTIGDDVIIDANTIIYPNVVIYDNTKIGKNCIIHAGTVLGSDGFGFEANTTTRQWHKIEHFGCVVIKDNVEIGANCAIDRAVLGETVIGDGSKLDNIIHLAHNVKLDENVVIAAHSGVGGGTTIGANSILAAKTGVSNNMNLPKETILLAGSALTSLNEPVKARNPYVSVIPAQPTFAWHKMMLYLQQLPKMAKQIKKLLKANNISDT